VQADSTSSQQAGGEALLTTNEDSGTAFIPSLRRNFVVSEKTGSRQELLEAVT
jgi:hypothetical protein